MFLSRILVTLVVLAVTSVSLAEQPLKVMTFNVRYGTASDGENRWENRRDLLVDVIHEADPDILGTQEVLAMQRTVLQAALPDHICLGVGRDDGKEEGERAAIFIRKDRFDVQEWGTRWLSESPEEPGSKGWGAHHSRIFTWAILKNKSTQEPLLVVVTHWDNASALSRSHSAILIAEWLRSAFPNIRRQIVMGDFNCGPESEPIQSLLKQSGIVDTLLRDKEEGTIHDFTGKPTFARLNQWVDDNDFPTTATEVLER